MSKSEMIWLAVGFAGQLAFTARFVVQWLASERKGESVIPLSFWYLSLTGGWLLLAYAIYRRDPVIITGQGLGAIVYTRNLALIHRKGKGQAGKPPAHLEAPAETDDVEAPPATVPLRKAG